MTVRRRNDELGVEELSWGKGTKAYRLILLGGVLAATTPGQNLFNAVGVKTPVVQEIVELRSELQAVKADVGHLKEDVAAVKVDVAAVKTKADKLEVSFTGFQVDFEKFRKEQK